MDPLANPYRPGAGRRPPLLAGRESLLHDFDVVRRRAEELGEGDRSWILYGLRGVGKTVLLRELLSQVSDRGWITTQVEAGASGSLSQALSRALVASMRTATGRHPGPTLKRLLGVFKAFSIKVDPGGAIALGVEVDPVGGVADTGRLPDDLVGLFETLGEAARDLGIGVLLLVDELQEATRDELTAINTAAHHIGQADRPLPLTVVGAGLPSLPAQLAEATSYAERLWDYRPVGLLSEQASDEALVIPARDQGVEWTPDGLAAALSAARGYPYFLQAIGKQVWDKARRSPINADDVQVGLVAAGHEVDDGLYRSRWERATPAQRQLLRSLATIGTDGSATIADIARHLGRDRPSTLSVARDELIRKGLVYAPARGVLAFTVPGMQDFVDRQP